MRRCARAALLCVLLACAGGCVVEEPVRRGPAAPMPASGAGDGRRHFSSVATPAPGDATVNSRVRVALAPLGTIPFDGQVLPLVSPDGRFVATETGEAPTWGALLAAPLEFRVPSTEIRVYEVASGRATPVPRAEPLPEGLLLGRSADSTGFLAEQVRADGARRVARINWAGAGLEWLTGEDAVYSDAWRTTGPLLCARRGHDDRAPAGAMRIDGRWTTIPGAGASIRFPSFDATTGRYYAYALGAAGIDVVSGEIANASAGPISARRRIASSADEFLAYQAQAAAQPFVPGGTDARCPGMLFYHPVAGRMMIFDGASGELIALAPRSIGGCWHPPAPGSESWGVFLTTPAGLVHQELRRDGASWRATVPVNVLSEPFVPRLTGDAERRYILIGPGGPPGSHEEATRLALFAMRLDPADPRDGG